VKLFWFAELVSAWDICFLFPRHVECGLAGAGKAKNLAGTALRPIQTRLTTRALKKTRLFVKFTRRKCRSPVVTQRNAVNVSSVLTTKRFAS
jgi:hypothetical protein